MKTRITHPAIVKINRQLASEAEVVDRNQSLPAGSGWGCSESSTDDFYVPPYTPAEWFIVDMEKMQTADHTSWIKLMSVIGQDLINWNANNPTYATILCQLMTKYVQRDFVLIINGNNAYERWAGEENPPSNEYRHVRSVMAGTSQICIFTTDILKSIIPKMEITPA